MAKRLPKTKFPTAATVSYERALVKMVNQVSTETLKLFDKHVSNELMQADAVTFRSGIFDGLQKMFSSLRNKVGSIFSDKRSNRAANQFVKSINQVSRRNLEQQAKVKGINLVANEPWLKDFMNERISNNVSYIKNLETETYERIEDIVREHIEKVLQLKRFEKALWGRQIFVKAERSF